MIHPARRLAALVVTLAATAVALAQPLNAPVERLITDQGLGSASVGVFVVDLATGDELASINADKPLIPASNMKLLTSGAFLAVLGPEFTFRTEVWRSGENILVVGSGDPALADPELLEEMGLSVEQFLNLWAEEIISRTHDISYKELLIDDRLFDEQRVHPSWPVDQLNRWYCAEVSALNFHTNVLDVHLAPGKHGAPPSLETEPEAAWLRPKNLAKTATRGANTSWVARDIHSNAMTIRGSVRWNSTEPVRVALYDPAMVFGTLLADRVAALSQGAPTARRVSPDEAPPKDELILAVETDLPTVLRRCNVDSYNLYAEALFKRLASEITGSQGSWPTGVAVMRMVLQEKLAGAHKVSIATDAVIADGSGMSRENRVTPRLMARWLESMSREPAEEVYLRSLAVAGKEGTLRKRFRTVTTTHTIRAKSGYLSGVSCLSGYILGEDDEPQVAFSVLVNDIPKNVAVRKAKEFHERVALEAEDWLRRRETAEAAP